MITEFGTAVATLKTTVELLKTLNNVVQDEKVRNAVFELQNGLLSLQAQLFDANARYEELSERFKELQRDLDSKNRWEEDAKKYGIFHPALGMTVYRLNDNPTSGEIWACPNCFGNQKISILNKPIAGESRFRCHGCGFEIFPTYTERRRRPGTGYPTDI